MRRHNNVIKTIEIAKYTVPAPRAVDPIKISQLNKLFNELPPLSPEESMAFAKDLRHFRGLMPRKQKFY